jgi:hypothetical protein
MKKSVILLVACLFAVSSAAQEAKPLSKKEAQALAATVMSLDERVPLPKFLLNGEHATEYCKQVVYLTDEQYSADSAAASGYVERLKALAGQFSRVKEKHLDEFGLRGMDYLLYSKLSEVEPRQQTLMDYCNNRREALRNARQRTMPEGRLLKFCYEEWGSSRPNPVKVTIEPDDQGTMQVSASTRKRHADDGEGVIKILATETILNELRQRIEAGKVYQMLGNYDMPHLFPDYPLPLGGPPSWMFVAECEGGKISTGGESGPVGVCGEIGYWLLNLVNEGNNANNNENETF